MADTDFIVHRLAVKSPGMGGPSISVNEAYDQWQQAMRLATVAERIYNRAVERQSQEASHG